MTTPVHFRTVFRNRLYRAIAFHPDKLPYSTDDGFVEASVFRQFMVKILPPGFSSIVSVVMVTEEVRVLVNTAGARTYGDRFCYILSYDALKNALARSGLTREVGPLPNIEAVDVAQFAGITPKVVQLKRKVAELEGHVSKLQAARQVTEVLRRCGCISLAKLAEACKGMEHRLQDKKRNLQRIEQEIRQDELEIQEIKSYLS